MDTSFSKSRATRYQFLSTLYRDEIPMELIAAMQQDEFLDGLLESVQGCGFMDLMSGAEGISVYLKGGDAEKLYNELRYDYADLFLNAGQNPVIPYESVHVTREPVVMQKPLLELREFFRKAGVHKNPEFKDLEEYVAVEMELLRYLLEKGNEDLYKDFFKHKYLQWIPSFCDQLATSAQTEFYQALAHFTRGALMCENMRIDGFTRGQETTQKLVGAVGALNLAPAYFHPGRRIGRS